MLTLDKIQNIISPLMCECWQPEGRAFRKLFKSFILFVCLFALFDSLRPINNLSVKQGRVFLG